VSPTVPEHGGSRAVLMGDPTYFSVVGGANPHTRDRWGRRKRVDRARAIRQWHGLRDRLAELGLRVVVVPPDPDWPGLVYPANAGVRFGDDFVLSHLIPTRAGETAHYRKVLEPLGLRCHTLRARFEGEADLFPAGDHYLFTHGQIRRQRFVPRLGIPPWKRIYGFRSDPASLEEIGRLGLLDREVLRLELRDERYYHGDTCLCSFGRGRRDLLVYEAALAGEALADLRSVFGERLVPLDPADARLYAANAFAFERGEESFLIVPDGISEALERRIRERDVTVVRADVSEFLKKGGGSVKCMIGDLGVLPDVASAPVV